MARHARARVFILGLSLAGCGGQTTTSDVEAGHGSSGSDAQSSSGGSNDGADDTTIGVEGSRGSSSSDSSDTSEGGSGSVCMDTDGSTDAGTCVPTFDICIPSTRYAAEEPCPPMAQGKPYTIFECNTSCGEFARLVSGTICAVGGATDSSVEPRTEAGTLVLCCPGEYDASWLYCEPPFM